MTGKNNSEVPLSRINYLKISLTRKLMMGVSQKIVAN